MNRDEALKILIAQGYCNAGKELKCEDCPCHDSAHPDDRSSCPSIKQIAAAVKVMEQEYGEN